MTDSTRTTGNSNGVGFFSLLFLVFLVLKLTRVIDWSWWWVTAPLWAPMLAVLAVFGITMAVWLTLRGLRRRRERKAAEPVQDETDVPRLW
jgi:transmembrane Fragile-X-F protein